MKYGSLFLSALLFTTISAQASVKIIKTCKSTLPKMEDLPKSSLVMEIIQKDNELKAKITERVRLHKDSYVMPAKILEENVRPGLSVDTNINSERSDLNEAESRILHAMVISESSAFKGIMSAGFDLKKIRSAKLYMSGDSLGQPTIVEAKDKNGKILGSFQIDLFLRKCQ
jgi:hypothetical protein